MRGRRRGCSSSPEGDYPTFRPALPFLATKATCFAGFLDSFKLLMSSQQFLLAQELESVFVACNHMMCEENHTARPLSSPSGLGKALQGPLRKVRIPLLNWLKVR